MPTLKPGPFIDADLTIGDFGVSDGLPGFVADHAEALGWEPDLLRAPARRGRAGAGPARRRRALLPGPLRRQPQEPPGRPGHAQRDGRARLGVRAFRDPFTDLGNMLRFDRRPAYAEAVLAAWCERVAGTPRRDARAGPRRRPLGLVDLAAQARPEPRSGSGPRARDGHRSDGGSPCAAVEAPQDHVLRLEEPTCLVRGILRSSRCSVERPDRLNRSACAAPRQGRDHHRRGDEVGPEEGAWWWCSHRSGRAGPTRSRSTHRRQHETLGGASAPTKKSDGQDDAHSEGGRSPRRTRTGDRLATLGDLEVDADGPAERSAEGGGHHGCERGDRAGDGEPAESVGVGWSGWMAGRRRPASHARGS